jgi:septal ring factor EnvC (AmiA/AmiB activator)
VAAEIDVLKQLEDRIQAAVTRIQQLERENETLAKRLAESELRFSQADAQVKEHEEARGEIRTRIEKILARFDGLELS